MKVLKNNIFTSFNSHLKWLFHFALAVTKLLNNKFFVCSKPVDVFIISTCCNVFLHASAHCLLQYVVVNNSYTWLQASYMRLFHTHQSSSAGDIVAMDNIRDILDNARLINGSCFSYGFKYLNNETNKVNIHTYISWVYLSSAAGVPDTEVGSRRLITRKI